MSVELVNGVHQAYARASDVVVDKHKLLAVLNAFETLYNARTTKKEEGYYIGNLIGTGKIEGMYKDVLGTVPQAIGRTRAFIDNSAAMHSHQGEFIARNLVYVLRKENFVSEPVVLLAPYIGILKDISLGNI